MAGYSVEVHHLSHQFGRHKVVDDVSLMIPSGSIYGFLGPNGAGKTTTLRLILGLLKKQHGKIRVMGRSLMDHRVEILRRIGSLIEQPSIYSHLSAAQNLELYRITYGCEKSRVREALAMTGLEGVGAKAARTYSLGMKQRLALAIALLHDPDLLILDEPANGLDPGGIIEMRNLLCTLNREMGKTILVSSHLLSEVEKIATDVAIINNGKVLFEGSLSRLQQYRLSDQLIEIEVDDAGLAKTALEGYFTAVEAGNNLLQVKCGTKERIAMVTDLLVKTGVKVYDLKIVKNDLESIFVQLTTI